MISWLRSVLTELYVQQEPTMVYRDKTGCVEWENGGSAKNFHERMNIDGKHHHLTSMEENEKIKIVPMRSNKMKADFLKKASGPHDVHQATMKSGLFGPMEAV